MFWWGHHYVKVSPWDKKKKIKKGCKLSFSHLYNNVSALGRYKGYMVKYNPLPEGVLEAKRKP